MLQDVTLVPGVDTQKTFELNQAGISISNLIRFKNNLAEKLGGWLNYYPSPVSTSPIRDIWGYQGLGGRKVLAVGATTSLTVVSCGVLSNITPQTNDTQPTPSFSITNGSNIVTVVDPGSSAGQYSAVQLVTPIALGGQLLSGAYPVNTAVDANTYTILAALNSTVTISSGGTLPTFQTTAGSAIVDVFLPNNQFIKKTGIYYAFNPATSVGGLSIVGPYLITSIIDSTHFQIGATAQASASSSATMNSSKAFLHYFNTIGPPPTAGAFGAGTFGAGAFGLGTPAGQGAGTPITATDWSLMNWGEILLSIPQNGPVYQWSPNTSLSNAQVVTQAPLTSIGGFVSQPQQILMLYGSTQVSGFQDPLIIRWSNSGDYTNWTVSNKTEAGSFHLPTGSTLVGGMQAPFFSVFWSDSEVWTATWADLPLVWSFVRVGAGCGLIGQHAAGSLAGSIMWAGISNFYMLGPNGVQVMPCSVWDFFFQNIDRANQRKVRCAPNSLFNEITWFFPTIGGNGENSAYVKVHIQGNEYEWDYGLLSRTAWIDITALGNPIGADNMGNLLQHETSFDASGSVINAYFETGYFALGDGSDIALIDWVIPDMKFGTQQLTGSGIVLFTFFVVDYPGDPERIYGPFAVQDLTEYINVRMRGRFARVRVESNDIGSFWRLGRIKFRTGPSGRR